MESGLIDKWKMTWWPRSKCRGQGTFAEVSQVNIQSSSPILALMAGGIGTAIIVLLLESFLYDKKRDITCLPTRKSDKKRNKAPAYMIQGSI